MTLPLRHEDIIRQQARDKGLDPALIAAVIYTESRFRDQTSPAGAKGLMQITPATARFIARESGGTAFTHEDLATPQVNIAYGAFYLRYLLDRYGGNETLAIAAYNGGEGNVDRWVDRRRAAGAHAAPVRHPVPETRAYVVKVEAAQHEYRCATRASSASTADAASNAPGQAGRRGRGRDDRQAGRAGQALLAPAGSASGHSRRS